MPDFLKQIPEGDTHERDVCAHCGYIAYDNPKIVAGAVVAHDGKVLLSAAPSSRAPASGPCRRVSRSA